MESPIAKAPACSGGELNLLLKNYSILEVFKAYGTAQRMTIMRAASSLTFSTGLSLPYKTKEKNANDLLNVMEESNSLLALGSLDLQGCSDDSSSSRKETTSLGRILRPLEFAFLAALRTDVS